MPWPRQAALDYLRAEVPASGRSAQLHNTVQGSALHQGRPDLAQAALDLMAEQGVPRDARTLTYALRLLVRLPSVSRYWAMLDHACRA